MEQTIDRELGLTQDRAQDRSLEQAREHNRSDLIVQNLTQAQPKTQDSRDEHERERGDDDSSGHGGRGR